MTVETGVVCEGNNTSNNSDEADWTSADGAPINGVAAEKINSI